MGDHQRVGRLHAQVKGTTPDGLPYRADDPVLLDWVQATPRAKDGSVTQLRVGFRGKDLAALEIVDAFGQRSQLLFSAVQQGLALPAERVVAISTAIDDMFQPGELDAERRAALQSEVDADETVQ